MRDGGGRVITEYRWTVRQRLQRGTLAWSYICRHTIIADYDGDEFVIESSRFLWQPPLVRVTEARTGLALCVGYRGVA